MNEAPSSIDWYSISPVTNRWFELCGSTYSRPNHHPYTLCEAASVADPGRPTQWAPPSTEENMASEDPSWLLAYIAYALVGSSGSNATPMRPIWLFDGGKPLDAS